MSRYREQSDLAYGRLGAPVPPLNWVQWTGIGFGLLGIALYGVYFAGRAHWIGQVLASPIIGFAMLMLGMLLVSSRRQAIPDPAPELAAARKRWMLIIVALCAAIIGGAVVLQFAGV